MIWPAHRALIYDFILYDTLVSNIYLYTYTCSIEGRGGRTFINLACKASTEFFFCLLRGDEEEREKNSVTACPINASHVAFLYHLRLSVSICHERLVSPIMERDRKRFQSIYIYVCINDWRPAVV